MEPSPQPLDDFVIDFLMSKTSETAELDFKYTVDLRKNSEFVKIVEDIFAMANYGGGYILFGFKQRRTGSFDKIGLQDKFHVDQADIQRKFNSYSNEPLELHYMEFQRMVNVNGVDELKKFAILYIPPSKTILYPIKVGTTIKKGKNVIIFRDKDILIRRGSITDRATPSEIEYIKKRINNEEFKIGLLSGEPDLIKENIYSNFFEVIKIPRTIYEFFLLPGRFNRFKELTFKDNIAFTNQGDFIFTFCNVSEKKYMNLYYDESFIKHDTNEFIKSDDNIYYLKRLLNNEIHLFFMKNNFRYDWKYRSTYFYPTKNGDRRVRWKGRYKTSTRLVVKKRYEEKLKMELYRHDSATIKMTNINNAFYLFIIPRLILSEDGINVIHDVKQGSVITSLVHDEYNDKYLNNVLFWISRLQKNTDNIKLNNRIIISQTPLIIDLDLGIRFDRPNTEFKDRIHELYSVEDLA